MHKIPPYFPLALTLVEGDRRIKRLNRDLPNCQGLGILVSIFFQLMKSKDMSYPVDDIDILAADINTSIALTTTVINAFSLFQFYESVNGKMFFSVDLNSALQPYFDKIEINSQNAKKGAEKRKEKAEKQVQQLENKLSAKDSTQRPLSNGSTVAEQREKKRKKEKKTTTAKKSSSCSEFEKFIEEKAEKNARNKPAYIATMQKRYQEGDPGVISEFEEWKNEQKRNEVSDILHFFQNKPINYNGSNHLILGVEAQNEDEFIVYLESGPRLKFNQHSLHNLYAQYQLQAKGA